MIHGMALRRGLLMGGLLVLISACVGVGYDDGGYVGGVYEPYGYDYGGWGRGYRVGPPRDGRGAPGGSWRGGGARAGRGAPSIPSGGHGGGGHGGGGGAHH
jgi:hypothetical protein